MDNEHFAAKKCLKCRDPEAYAKANPPAPEPEPLGEAIGSGPEEAKQQQIEAPSAASATPFFLKPGDVVSINLKQRKFIILPSGWELNPRKWNSEIPNPIDPVELKMLRMCLEAGDLVKGKVFTGISKDQTTLTKAATLLGEKEVVMRELLGLIVQHKGVVGGYLPYEIFRYLMRYEDDNEHRKRVLGFLQSGLDFLGSGPPRSTPVLSKTIEQITEMKF